MSANLLRVFHMAAVTCCFAKKKDPCYCPRQPPITHFIAISSSWSKEDGDKILPDWRWPRVCLEIKESELNLNDTPPHSLRPPMEYMKIHMQNAVAGNPSMSAAPWGDEALVAGIDLIAAAAAVHDFSVETWKIMYKFAICFIKSQQIQFWGQGAEEWSSITPHVKVGDEWWSGSSSRDPDHKQMAVNKSFH